MQYYTIQHTLRTIRSSAMYIIDETLERGGGPCNDRGASEAVAQCGQYIQVSGKLQDARVPTCVSN